MKYNSILAVCLLLLGLTRAEELAEYSQLIRGKQQNTPKTYNSQWAVQLQPGQTPESLTQLGFEVIGQVGHLQDFYLVQHAATRARHERMREAAFFPSLDVSSSLSAHPHVKWQEQQALEKRVSRISIGDPLYSSQWHLRNTGQFNGVSGYDANVQGAWDAGFTGNGVQIAIVDDGFQFTHPDLSARYVASSSHNYRSDGNPNSPAPDTTQDFHGTSAAGVALAESNSACGVGVAFEASGAGIRLIGGDGASSATEATALGFMNDQNDIYSNSWGPADEGLDVGPASQLVTSAFSQSVTSGRGGLGNIYVWSAGNGGLSDDNSNYDGYANSRFVMSIGAVGNNGVHSYYSEPGANVLVCAPSDSANPIGGIRTTDLLGSNGYDQSDCTSDFGGTSSACPVITGVVALMLQANPTLTWRDVPVILAATARRTANSYNDADWVTNGGGYHVNHKYGFGLVDATAAVRLASNYTKLSTMKYSTTTSSQTANIPDNSASGPSVSLTISDSFYVEKVVITVNINHSRAGDLRVVLTSPSGTQSVLAEVHAAIPAIVIGSRAYELGVSANGGRIPDTIVQAAGIQVSPSSGCSPLSNCRSLKNNIAFIPAVAAECEFDQRALAAQKCGALAAIVYDLDSSHGSDVYIIPSSGQAGVTIPMGFLSYAGARQWRSGDTVAIGRSYYRANSYGTGWPFSSVRHLGEGSAGTWTLSVTDLREEITGILREVKLEVYGSSDQSAFPAGEVGTPPPPSSASSLFASFSLLALVALFLIA